MQENLFMPDDNEQRHEKTCFMDTCKQQTHNIRTESRKFPLFPGAGGAWLQITGA